MNDVFSLKQTWHCITSRCAVEALVFARKKWTFRAYGKSARDALQAAGIARKQLWKQLDLILPYNYYERLRQEVERFGGIVSDTEYSADICIHSLLPADRAPDFCARVVDLTRGAVTPLEIGEEFRAVPVEG